MVKMYHDSLFYFINYRYPNSRQCGGKGRTLLRLFHGGGVFSFDAKYSNCQQKSYGTRVVECLLYVMPKVLDIPLLLSDKTFVENWNN